MGALRDRTRLQRVGWRRVFAAGLSTVLALALSACAALSGSETLRVNVVGIEPLQGEGFELRFAVKLRAQNSGEAAIDYDGVALELELNGNALASGVSAQKGSVPRYGEALFSVPVSISAIAALRQALGFADGQNLDKVPYVLRGKLAHGAFGAMRFTDEGSLRWPQGGKAGG
jgi:hypothetical protein